MLRRFYKGIRYTRSEKFASNFKATGLRPINLHEILQSTPGDLETGRPEFARD